MKLLFLAPQPFFQDRGTPIAVRLALQVLAQRSTDRIDLLAYHEGSPVTIPNVEIHRIAPPSFIRNVGAGASLKKLLCDVYFLFSAIRLVWRNRAHQYALVHAVEESVFIALLIRWIWGIPYIYDMDSSLALQLTEKWRFLKPLSFFFNWIEGVAVRNSIAVVPVCDALAVIAEKHGARDQEMLRDISLLNLESEGDTITDLRAFLKLDSSKQILMYIGNLESYQGVDLLVASFASIAKSKQDAHVIIIGGAQQHRAAFEEEVTRLGLCDRIHLLGPKPVASLNGYLTQADILVSPRTDGNNTPMKIYSYLHSGKVILATRLPTHTQVMNDSLAKLAGPTVPEFARAMSELIDDPALRQTLGAAAQREAEKKYTFEVFNESLNRLYDRVGGQLGK